MTPSSDDRDVLQEAAAGPAAAPVATGRSPLGAFLARHGIVPSLRWGFVALTPFMIGDGIEAGFLSPYLDERGFDADQVSVLHPVGAE